MYCECGCGQRTTIATKNHTKNGYVKGQPRRWVQGHQTRQISLAVKRRARVPKPSKINSGYCECGCGSIAPIATATSKRDGHVVGYPMRFITGHNTAGRVWTDKMRRNLSKAKRGKKLNLSSERIEELRLRSRHMHSPEAIKKSAKSRKGLPGWKPTAKQRQAMSLRLMGTTGRPMTPDLKERIFSKQRGQKRPSVAGSNNGNWKGGTTPERKKFQAQWWSRAVKARDNFTCQRCSLYKPKGLHAHHVKPYATHPELRYVVSNGIALCKDCHWATHRELLLGHHPAIPDVLSSRRLPLWSESA